ncbi:hypothetical protein [Hymenobacter sp. B81]|uniref:hypothetical protein n=1 Tax=Hymenobacter sp. B81 TaxID=3344878 RepID=UPI0037DDE20E
MGTSPKPPIGFGRKPDPDPNGTGDGQRFQFDGTNAPQEEAPQRPTRQPLVEPVFVDDLEATEICAAYNIFPLVPLGHLEHQLLQVIQALEQRVKELEPDRPDDE